MRWRSSCARKALPARRLIWWATNPAANPAASSIAALARKNGAFSAASMSPQMTRRGALTGAGCGTPVGFLPRASHALASASSGVIAGAVSKSAGTCQAELPIIATVPIPLMRTSARPPMQGRPRNDWSNLKVQVRPMRAPIDSVKSEAPSASESRNSVSRRCAWRRASGRLFSRQSGSR